MQVITLNCRVLIKQIKRKLLLKRFKSCDVVCLHKTNVTDLKASEWKKKDFGGGGGVTLIGMHALEEVNVKYFY